MRSRTLVTFVLASALGACASGGPQWEPAATPLAESEIVPGQVYEVEQLTTLPRPTNLSLFGGVLEREYPPALRDAGRGGRAVAALEIDEEGNVVHAAIVESSGEPTLDLATVRAVRFLRFRPGLIGRTPVRVRVELPVEWTIRR